MSSVNNVARYGAAIWCLIFGILHALWASGFYILLPAEQAAEAFKREGFFIYNIVVAILCIIAGFIALMQSNVIHAFIPKSVVRFLAYSAATLLSLRGIAGIGHILYQVLLQGKALSFMVLWDVWFCAGGILFFLNTRSKARQSVFF